MASHPQPKSVIIVGGSLAGLAHALTFLSLPNPPTVRILERSPTALLHDQGAGIVAGGETLQFFDKYVRAGRDIAITSPMRYYTQELVCYVQIDRRHKLTRKHYCYRHYLDRRGDEMFESVEHRAQRMTSWDLLYHLLRWRVEGMQSNYVTGLTEDERPKGTYENGCTITNIEDAGTEGVRVTYNHESRGEGQTAVADMIIAADGGSSTIRRLFNPTVSRDYAGYVVRSLMGKSVT